MKEAIASSIAVGVEIGIDDTVMRLRRTVLLLPLLVAISQLLGVMPGGGVALASSTDQPPAAVSAEKTPPPPEVKFSGALLSVMAKNADIRTLVDAIAAKSGVEIVLDMTITGKATVDFADVKVEEGLKRVLKDVVEGGFVAEYIRKNSETDHVDLQKIVIARRAGWPMSIRSVEEKDVLRINEMYVGEVKGVEVLFVPWGDGDGQIPIRTIKVGAKEVRQGFERFRVGTDGTFYFLGWPHEKAWVYSRDGRLRGTIDLHGMRGNSFDVDHEGNLYLMVNPSRHNDAPQQEVFVYNKELREIAHVWAAYAPGLCNVVRDGALRNACDSEKVLYDFRYLGKTPSSNNAVLKSPFMISVSPVGTDPLESNRPVVAALNVKRARLLGIPEDLIATPYTQQWEALGPASDPTSEIAFHKEKLYLLVGISSGRRFSDDYGLAVLDLGRLRSDFCRIREKDSFVYEKGELRENVRHFDIDPDGNVFQLLTMNDGVHIFMYRLGEQP